MRLIHCADLHLDSRMESHLSPQQARERRREIVITFRRMIRWAKEHEVDAILIAGDLFDTERVSAQTAALVLDGIREAKDIDFLYLRGNHDESTGAFYGAELPENLRLFSGEWTYYTYDTVTVAGLELNRENWNSCYDSLKLEQDKTNIVMLHGQTSSQPGEELVCLNALRGKNIRYLALGHIHGYRKEPLDENGDYCYCGCLEGRGFDECGAKGFVLLEAEGGNLRSEFIPFAKRTVEEVRVDISDLTTIPEQLRAAEEAVSDLDSSSMVRVILTGSFGLDTHKDTDYLREALSSRFYFVRVSDESRLALNPEEYEHDISLKGAFIRSVMSSDGTDEDKADIIRLGLLALYGEEVTL